MAIIIALAVALTVALKIPPSSRTTESTLATQLSPPGLRLALLTNTTIIRSAQAIDAKATIYNTLTQNTTIYPNSTKYSNVLDWDRYYLAPCFPGWNAFALSIAIFRGHYTDANFSATANPLMLIPPQNSSCAAMPTLQSLQFQPLNDTAEGLFDTVTGPQHMVVTLTTELDSACATSNNPCTSAPGVKGYWTGSANPLGTNAVFHYFEAGKYTIVAADSWGQTVYLYFEVV